MLLATNLLVSCGFKDMLSNIPNLLNMVSKKEDKRITFMKKYKGHTYPEYTIEKILKGIYKKGEWRAYKSNGINIVW